MNQSFRFNCLSLESELLSAVISEVHSKEVYDRTQVITLTDKVHTIIQNVGIG